MLNSPLELSEKSALHIINTVKNNIVYDSVKNELSIKNLDDHNTILLVQSAVESLGGNILSAGNSKIEGYNPKELATKLASLGVNFKGRSDLQTTNVAR